MKTKIYQLLPFAIALLFVSSLQAQVQIPTVANPADQQQAVEDPPPIEGDIFKVVEQMPRFPGCEEQGLDRGELHDCATDKMRAYIYSNLKYPTAAKNQKVEGMTVIQFIVTKDGSMRNMKIVRDLDMDKHAADFDKTCGQAALEVLEKMNKEITWISGKQRGRPVNVQYTLPVKFKL
ncbi:MAG: energy transducer TonB [Saprospiraceae bacterium]|nr:energy transducer TonB [Saprospiraceae bacterium]